MENTEIMLAVTGREQSEAVRLGLTPALLAYRLDTRLTRENAGMEPPPEGSVLVLCDAGLSPEAMDPAMLAEDIFREAHRLAASGLLLDCTGTDYPALHRLAALLDEGCARRSMTLLAHAAYASELGQGKQLIDTRITAGSLERRLWEESQRVGAAHLAAEIVPLSLDFPLPCGASEGIPLGIAQREALMARLGVLPYFSDELCARYFTYMAEDGQPHFVLFDDAASLCAKLRLLERMEITPAVLLWTEVRELLPEALAMLRESAAG